VDGPVGVTAFRAIAGLRTRTYSPGWEAKVFLKEGIGYTYPWIEEQVKTQ
jgi:hypothetical protein